MAPHLLSGGTPREQGLQEAVHPFTGGGAPSVHRGEWMHSSWPPMRWDIILLKKEETLTQLQHGRTLRTLYEVK